MNKLLENVKKYVGDIKKIEYKNNYYIIFSDKVYYLKEIDYNLKEVFDYFSQIDFSFYGKLLSNYNETYLLYCINKNIIGKKDGERLILVLSLLQEKSITSREYEKEEKKKIYDNIHSMVDQRMKYYLNLQDKIDDFDFPPPSYYLLVKNISNIYKLLHYSFSKLDEWYEKSNLIREVFLIKDVCFDNFYSDDELSYFLDYGRGDRGFLINDFVEFYRKECFNVDMNYLFDLYQEKVLLKDYEISLLLCLISIPEKIVFNNNSYSDTIRVRRVVDYVDKVGEFLSKENKENKEADKQEFKEENDDIKLSSNEN